MHTVVNRISNPILDGEGWIYENEAENCSLPRFLAIGLYFALYYCFRDVG